MSVHETEPESVIVRDIMTRSVITTKESDTAADAAKLMAKHNIGCVLVSGKKGETIGIITERDIVQRIAAKNLLPSNVTVGEAMSKPVVTVKAGATITDAARLMNQRKIRRLAVIENGKLMGILTMKDILEVTPAIIDLASEKSQAGLGRIPRTSSSRLQGYCDECETWSEALVQKDGVFLCQDCAKELGPVEDEN
ncbi:CBS domain-containing protein [Candidatus Bathyarchaeota archaeon]|nr:MAG: CBS domain-containing protein [Candidatus Bathyarchaeota archaeon]